MLEFDPTSILPPPSARTVELLEEGFVRHFPASYRSFLQSSNGLIPKENETEIGGHNISIEFFLPILDSPKDHERGWSEIDTISSQIDSRLVCDKNQVGVDLIPIAALFAGNFIVLDYRKNRDMPEIAIWDHERSIDFAPYAPVISNSFEDFIQAL